jgi:DNA-directed RNA polymerase
MGYFNRDDRGSNHRSGRNDRGGRGFSSGRPSFNRGGNDGPREMFKTVCSSCGKDCEVPFKPTTGKPVYCSDCFEKMGPRNDRPERPERNRSNFADRPQVARSDNNKAQFEALSAKLDRIIELLTTKTEEKTPEPVAVEEKTEKVSKTKKVKAVKKEKTAVEPTE